MQSYSYDRVNFMTTSKITFCRVRDSRPRTELEKAKRKIRVQDDQLKGRYLTIYYFRGDLLMALILILSKKTGKCLYNTQVERNGRNR